jgi:hypothetical protein
MNKTTRLLIGGGAGAWLGWLFAKRLAERQPRNVHITLKKEGNSCVVHPVDDVEISADLGPVRWIITNPRVGGCGTVKVKIDNWKRRDTPKEDDEEDDNQPPVISVGALERKVKPGQTKIIPALGATLERAEYKYDVLINGNVVLDPIVKLIL